jgi:hypothetical protein
MLNGMCGQPCCPAALPLRKWTPVSISKKMVPIANLDLVMARDIRVTIENRIPIIQHQLGSYLRELKVQEENDKIKGSTYYHNL